MKKCIWLFILAFIGLLPIKAEKFYNDVINLTNVSLWQQGQNLYVTMHVDMSNLDIKSDYTLYLIPTLSNGTDSLALQNIIINGKSQQKKYEKSIAAGNAAPEAIVIPFNRKDGFDYIQTIPYKPWMAKANYNLVEKLYKKDKLEMNTQELITNKVSTEVQRLAEFIPLVAFIEPPVEIEKIRSDIYDAYLDFKVNQSNILPTYMNNKIELGNIQKMLNKINNDSNLTVTKVTVRGFASPEGPQSFNNQLSKKRTVALTKYLASNSKIPAKLFIDEFDGENWEGLVTALDTSNISSKDSLIYIINTATSDQQRKELIMKLDNGRPYRYILKTLYPSLRNSQCEIDYTVKDFTLKESIYILGTDPKYLSQNEMYKIAMTYPRGSKSFMDVMDIAIQHYPEDQIANLNEAAVALNKRDLKKAVRYLQKSNKRAAEYLNNCGVYNFYNGNISQAAVNFQQAAQLGNVEAKDNFNKMENLINKKVVSE